MLDLIPLEKKRKNKFQRNDFLILIIASLLLFAVFYYTYSYKSPAIAANFPTLNLNFQGDVSTSDYVDGNFELDSPDNSEDVTPLNCKIKIRGSFNAKMPKKGYRIELAEKVSLLGMREDDDWQLFSMFLDLTDMRIKLSFDLWRSLLATDSTAILPESEYVILYVNGELKGLYLLAEKNDRRLFGLEDAQNNGDSSLIFQSDSHGLNFYEHSDETWSQDWPNEYDGIYIKDDVFSTLIPFIKETSNNEFFNNSNGIYTKFEKINLIDFFIFNYFILHLDFWSRNYFLVRNTFPNKFFLIPWDFDSSFGQFLTRNYDSDQNLELEIFQRNYLFFRLLGNKDFRIAVKERWFSLRETIWSEESILDMLTEIFKEIKVVLELDVNKWYLWYYYDGDIHKADQAIKNLFDWIPERLEFCDAYFTGF